MLASTADVWPVPSPCQRARRELAKQGAENRDAGLIALHPSSIGQPPIFHRTGGVLMASVKLEHTEDVSGDSMKRVSPGLKDCSQA